MSASSLLKKFDRAAERDYGLRDKPRKKRGKKKSTKSGSRRRKSTTTTRRKSAARRPSTAKRGVRKSGTKRRSSVKRKTARKSPRKTARKSPRRSSASPTKRKKKGKRKASKPLSSRSHHTRYSRVPRRPSGFGSMRASPPMLPVYSGQGTWAARDSERDWRGQPRRHKKAGKLGAHRRHFKRVGGRWPHGFSEDHSAYAKKGARRKKAKKKGRRKTRRDWPGAPMRHKKAGKLGAHRRAFPIVGGRWPRGFSADHSAYAKKGARRKKAKRRGTRRDPSRRPSRTRKTARGRKGMTYQQALAYFR